MPADRPSQMYMTHSGAMLFMLIRRTQLCALYFGKNLTITLW
jgi:hypothetical protein